MAKRCGQAHGLGGHGVFALNRPAVVNLTATMDNVVLLNDAPNRENALKFMGFLPVPENVAAMSNYARYALGVTGAGAFIEVCDEATQAVYDQIWTNVKK